MSVNFRLCNLNQRKAFYRKTILESSCVRKETVDIDILVTSKNTDWKIIQAIKITSRPPSRKIPIEKTWAWYTHFGNEPRVQGRQQVKKQQL